MSQSESEEDPPPTLNLSRVGTWEDVIATCEDIESLLCSVKPEDVNNHISEAEFEKLCKEWKGWRPHTEDVFSKEMREKTAEQSSIAKGKLEEKGVEAKEEMKNAGNSLLKAAKNVEKGGLEEAKNHLSDTVKCTGRAVDSTLRQGIRTVEENIYEKVILKANSLYFDNSALNAILSKSLTADSSERYRLTLHSNNPHLRKFFAERIDWDVC